MAKGAGHKWSSKRGEGQGIKFVRGHVSYQGNDCLIYPLKGRDGKGYASLGYCGKQLRAHRVMCELAHGPAPTPEHHAAHSCGNGHNACVNPRHLSWKTASENQFDRVAHGTTKPFGSPRRKLTPDQVEQIRALRGKKTQAEIGAMFGIRPETAGQIQRGEWHTGEPPKWGRKVPGDHRAIGMRALRLREEGKTYKQIATELDVSRVTVRRFIDAVV